MGLSYFPNGISTPLVIGGAGQWDGSGSALFVDCNSGSDSNDGSSWDRALKTFARATTLNNIDIARGSDRWARRNAIFLAADTTTETLIAFPNKCDVIGVGSYDANKKPGITGNHVPVNASNYGTRFINVWFKAPAVASPIITLASTSSGIEFIGCTFDGVAGTVTTGITATASSFLKVINCEFFGAFATSNISIGAGAMVQAVITGNTMEGSLGTGIVISGSATFTYASLIKDNFIAATGKAINDASGLMYIVNNRLVTAAAQGTAGAGCIVGGAKTMQDNRISASDVANAVVPAQGTLA